MLKCQTLPIVLHVLNAFGFTPVAGSDPAAFKRDDRAVVVSEVAVGFAHVACFIRAGQSEPVATATGPTAAAAVCALIAAAPEISLAVVKARPRGVFSGHAAVNAMSSLYRAGFYPAGRHAQEFVRDNLTVQFRIDDHSGLASATLCKGGQVLSQTLEGRHAPLDAVIKDLCGNKIGSVSIGQILGIEGVDHAG